MTYNLIIDDFIGPWGYSKGYVRNELKKHGSAPLKVKISSLGGSLDDALDIRQQFIDHGNVTVYLSGFVASAATVIAMGAKRVVMDKYAFFLVHKCSNYIFEFGSYNADQMQEVIDKLTANKLENDKIDLALAAMYATRCGKKIEDIMDTLTAGLWLDSKEAHDMGFVDEVVDNGTKPLDKNNFTANLQAKFNAFGLPTPAVYADVAVNSGASGGAEPAQRTLVQRIADAVWLVFSDPADKTVTITNSATHTAATMKKYNFKSVSALLDKQDITAGVDGKVSIDAELLEKVNNHIEELEQTNSANATKLDELEKRVAAIDSAPGDTSDDVIEEDVDGETSKIDYFETIKNLI